MIKRKSKRSAGRPSAELSAQVDRAVLAAAAEVFHEKGFSAASMQAIAAKAGASRQTLYARFPNKTVLFEALMEARAADLLSRLRLVLDENEKPEVALRRFARELLAAFISSDVQRLHYTAIAERRSFPDLAAIFFKRGPNRGKQLLQGYLEAQVRKRVLKISNIEFAAEQLVGALVGSVVIRSTLAQPQIVSAAHKQNAWAETAVGVFLSAFRR